MKTLFVQCGECGIRIPGGETCIFAVENRKIGGREYTFCCSHCAEEFDRKKFHRE